LGKREREQAERLRQQQAIPAKIKIRLVTIPEEQARAGVEISPDFLYFGFDWRREQDGLDRRLDLVVVEQVHEKKPDKAIP
jgi:hypothetical protein